MTILSGIYIEGNMATEDAPRQGGLGDGVAPLLRRWVVQLPQVHGARLACGCSKYAVFGDGSRWFQRYYLDISPPGLEG